MPVNVPDKLPAIDILKKENIFVMDESRALHQDIRPLKIIILNLMPIKITTETDLLRLLSNSPLQIEIEFMKIKGHKPKNTPMEHMEQFYKNFDELNSRKYDGLIVTGAPVELLSFEDVTYWDELKEIFEWARYNVYSTLFICWAAQAALNHYYGIKKHELPGKLFGVFKHTHPNTHLPILRGFDDIFFIPHSRYTEVRAEDIEKVEGLQIIATSEKAGVAIVQAKTEENFISQGIRNIHATPSTKSTGETWQRKYLSPFLKIITRITTPPRHRLCSGVQQQICCFQTGSTIMYIRRLHIIWMKSVLPILPSPHKSVILGKF